MTAKCLVLYNFVHTLTAKLGVLTSETKMTYTFETCFGSHCLLYA